MTTQTIGLYLTRPGQEAIRLKAHSSALGVHYSWIGTYGAGSGQQLSAYIEEIKRFQQTKRGMQTIVDVNTFNEAEFVAAHPA